MTAGFANDDGKSKRKKPKKRDEKLIEMIAQQQRDFKELTPFEKFLADMSGKLHFWAWGSQFFSLN